MQKLKYVRFKDKGPVLFSQSFEHAEFETMCYDDIIISAAFAAVGDDGSVVTYGESLSLELKNQEGDAKEIWKLLQEIDSEGELSCRVIPENSWEDKL